MNPESKLLADDLQVMKLIFENDKSNKVNEAMKHLRGLIFTTSQGVKLNYKEIFVLMAIVTNQRIEILYPMAKRIDYILKLPKDVEEWLDDNVVSSVGDHDFGLMMQHMSRMPKNIKRNCRKFIDLIEEESEKIFVDCLQQQLDWLKTIEIEDKGRFMSNFYTTMSWMSEFYKSNPKLVNVSLLMMLQLVKPDVAGQFKTLLLTD